MLCFLKYFSEEILDKGMDGISEDHDCKDVKHLGRLWFLIILCPAFLRDITSGRLPWVCVSLGSHGTGQDGPTGGL